MLDPRFLPRVFLCFLYCICKNENNKDQDVKASEGNVFLMNENTCSFSRASNQ